MMSHAVFNNKKNISLKVLKQCSSNFAPEIYITKEKPMMTPVVLFP